MSGLGADEQVRRGLSGQALLRRLRVRRRDRAAGDRPREGAVRRRARQRPAARGRAGQHGRLPRAAAAGRDDHGPEPPARRPPQPRHEDQRVRPALRHRPVRGLGDRPPDRHGRGRAPGQGASPQAPARRLVGLPARARLPPLPGDRRRGRRAADGRHGALRRPRRGRHPPEPGPVRRRRHEHRPQDPRRPALRPDPVPRGVREEDQLRGLPGPAGRSARARDRGQGRGVQDRRLGPLQGAPGADRRRRPGAGRGAARRWLGCQRADRRHGRPSRARRPARVRARRPAGRGPAALDRHHGQPECGAVRPAAADGDVRSARRYARSGHARPSERTTSTRSARSSPARCSRTSTAPRPSSPSASRRSSIASRCTRSLGTPATV